jgi:general secretion pathway protein M
MISSLKNLSTRERYAVYLATVVVSIFVVIQLMVFPVLDKRKSLKKQLKAKTAELEQMIELKTEYDAIKGKSKSFDRRTKRSKKGFTLFSHLDELAGKAGVKDNISSMKPSSSDKISRVEVELQAITMEKLSKYLHMVETSMELVFIKRLSITRKGKQEGSINAVLQVETSKAIENG